MSRPLLSWPFDDPAPHEGSRDDQLEKFRAVRYQIDARIRQWLVEEGTQRIKAPAECILGNS